jgi:hypothetical protein
VRDSISRFVVAAVIGIAIALAYAPVWAKTVKECDAAYAANKDAIKSSGEKKKDFIAACRVGTETIPGGAAAPAGASVTTASSGASSGGKTVKECDAEYSANKEAIKASGQKKKDFVAACRAGTETVPAGAAPAAPPATNAAPAPAPAPAGAAPGAKTAKECDAEYKANKGAIKASGQKKKDFVAACRAGTETIPSVAAPTAPTAPATNAAPPPAQTAAPAPSAAPAAAEPESRQAPVSASEAQAQASCPGDTVVWVNTRSGIYHFRGTHNYGTTKEGIYMCEAAAKAAGDRAAENEKHP